MNYAKEDEGKLSTQCKLCRHMTTQYIKSGHICPLSSHCVDTCLCNTAQFKFPEDALIKGFVIIRLYSHFSNFFHLVVGFAVISTSIIILRFMRGTV